MNQESRKAGKNFRDSKLTQEIIACAIRLHRALGPGFLESVYEEALAVEFAFGGIQFIRQHPVPPFYRDHQVGEHRLDFLVEGKIVVELKAISQLRTFISLLAAVISKPSILTMDCCSILRLRR